MLTASKQMDHQDQTISFLALTQSEVLGVRLSLVALPLLSRGHMRWFGGVPGRPRRVPSLSWPTPPPVPGLGTCCQHSLSPLSEAPGTWRYPQCKHWTSFFEQAYSPLSSRRSCSRTGSVLLLLFFYLIQELQDRGNENDPKGREEGQGDGIILHHKVSEQKNGS